MGVKKALIDRYCKLNGKVDAKRLAKKVPFTGLKVVDNIPYADDGHPMHTLDVYRPDEDGLLPVIIDIHGGAWIYGTKEINAHYCKGLAKYGFTVVNLNYRTIREGYGGTFPNIFKDIFAALNWVEKNIADYGGDLNNVFLTGDSAGAHLAGLTLLINGNEKWSSALDMKTGLKIRSVGLTCGVSDLEPYKKMKSPLVKYLFTLFFGENWKRHEFIDFVSFQNHDLSILPPVFLNSAYGDFLKGDVRKLHQRLNEKGVENELVFINKPTTNKLGHVYNVLYPEWEESVLTTDAMIAFFRRHTV